MGRRSSVSRLPPEIRSQLDRWIRDGSATLDELVEALRDLGPEGETVSRSALHRYRQRMEQVGAKLRAAGEVSRVWVEELGESPDGDVGQLVQQLLSTVAMNAAMGALEDDEDGGIDARDLHFLARAVKDIESSRKTWVEREQKVRELVKARAAEVVQQEGRRAGISEDTVRRIEEELRLL